MGLPWPPIELQVDRNLGSKKKDLSPVAFRQACRAWAEKFVGIQREEFVRLGILGEWDAPYLTMAPPYQADIVRELATCIEKGLVYKAKKSVHWCISCRTALAEAEVEYDEHHESPSIDVKFPLRRERSGELGGAASLPSRQEGLRGHLDDDALDAAREPRHRLPSRFDYAFFPVEGPTTAPRGLDPRLGDARARQPSVGRDDRGTAANPSRW